MDIYVIDRTDGVIDIVSTYQSVIWNVQYFGQNDFQLVVNGSDENVELLKVGRYLAREEDRYYNNWLHPMAIQNTQLDFDPEKGWILTVSGKGLKNELFRRRIIWGQTSLTGLAELAIRQVVNDNVINPANTDRKINRLYMSAVQGFTETIDVQLMGENLADWLEEICTTYGYGWDVNYQDNGWYVFKLNKGYDRSGAGGYNPVIFSPELDNLISASYKYNMAKYTNAALIGGEGEGSSQRTATIGTASGWDRFETFVDGSSVSSNGEIITLSQYLKMLQEYGQTQLDQTAYTKSFSGEIDPDGVYKLGSDYALGDIVKITNGKGISATARIIEIIYAEDDSGYSVVPTFSEWEVIE